MQYELDTDQMDDLLSLKLSPEFITELREIIQQERELQKDASAYFNAMAEKMSANHEKLKALESKLEVELHTQTQTYSRN